MDEMGLNRGTEIAGYKIFVDGKQKQFVTNAHLSKVSILILGEGEMETHV